MTLQRQLNPLPQGVYWIDVFSPPLGGTFPNDYPKWQSWIGANGAKVAILKHQGMHGPLSGALDPNFAQAGASSPQRDFLVFQVRDAVTTAFPTELGFPTIVELGTPTSVDAAKAAAVTSDDTVSKLPPESPLDVAANFVENLSTAGKIALGLAVLYLGVRVLEANNRR